MHNTHFCLPGQLVGNATSAGSTSTGSAAQPSPATHDSLSVSPLDITAKFASPPPLSSLATRYMLQAAAREMLPAERIAKCLRLPTGSRIYVLYSAAVRAGHFGGLQTCGSIWMCPVCAVKISERRRVELQTALSAYDGVVALATFTLQHDRSQALPDLLTGFLDSFRSVRSGAPWQRIADRHGVVGAIRALEVTHGKNGWHPHIHVLFFLAAGADVAAFGEVLRSRWLALLAARGLSASALGFDIQVANDAVGDYVAKFGSQWTAAHELTKSHVKRGRDGNRSVVQLLTDYAYGDLQAGAIWSEYARHFKGKKHLVWSTGLRARLISEPEQSDEELAARMDQDSIILASLSFQQWRVVLANDARSDLLAVASSGDVDQVMAFLVALGIQF